MERPWECSIEPPDSISHGVTYYIIFISMREVVDKNLLNWLMTVFPALKYCMHSVGKLTAYKCTHTWQIVYFPGDPSWTAVLYLYKGPWWYWRMCLLVSEIHMIIRRPWEQSNELWYILSTLHHPRMSTSAKINVAQPPQCQIVPFLYFYSFNSLFIYLLTLFIYLFTYLFIYNYLFTLCIYLFSYLFSYLFISLLN